jgi:hypothetical protein
MYGNTAEAGFRRLEGGVDSGVETLFFWDSQRRPIALAVNLSCPAQEVEERNSIHADFWHEARERLRVGLGLPELPVLAWCGAAGDVSPHPMHRKAAEARMDRLRGVSREVELGRRISAAVLETLPVARADVRWKVALVHSREEFRLVRRGIRAEEAEAARRALDDYGREKSPDHRVRALMGLERSILNRFEAREERTPYLAEVHVVRLGDVVIASNPFELFSDFGVQLKARSPALQTMIVQLSNGYGMYVPTESAMRSGGYSGKPHVSRVGAAGGQQLVDSSVHLIEQLFRE